MPSRSPVLKWEHSHAWPREGVGVGTRGPWAELKCNNDTWARSAVHKLGSSTVPSILMPLCRSGWVAMLRPWDKTSGGTYMAAEASQVWEPRCSADRDRGPHSSIPAVLERHVLWEAAHSVPNNPTYNGERGLCWSTCSAQLLAALTGKRSTLKRMLSSALGSYEGGRERPHVLRKTLRRSAQQEAASSKVQEQPRQRQNM